MARSLSLSGRAHYAVLGSLVFFGIGLGNTYCFFRTKSNVDAKNLSTRFAKADLMDSNEDLIKSNTITSQTSPKNWKSMSASSVLSMPSNEENLEEDIHHIWKLRAGADVPVEDWDNFVRRTIAIPATTTFLKNKTHAMQLRHGLVLEQMARLDLETQFMLGTTFGGTHDINPYITRVQLEMCDKRKDKDYCLLFEDDTIFHPDLKRHLIPLLRSLPPHWSAIHLCPGPLIELQRKTSESHRKQVLPVEETLQNLQEILQNKSWSISKNLKLVNPEGDLYFKEFPRLKRYPTQQLSVGGPFACIIRQELAKKSLAKLKIKTARHNDQLFSKSPIAHDAYVAKDPLLCYHMPGKSIQTDEIW